jgi:Ricin-type beta-trefoil lectin domain-like
MSNIREIILTKWSLVALLLGQAYLMGCDEPSGFDIEDEDEIQTLDALADPDPSDVTFNNTAEAWVPVTYYYIRAKHSKKCLHQHGGVLDNGAPITQWDCVDQENVQWRIEPSPTKGYYYIKARHSDKCAHQHGGTYGDGDPITQWECVNQGNVKWKIVSAGKGYYYIKAQHSGKCMHVHGGGSGNGDPITQWSCINQPNVQWTFRAVGH